MSRGRWLGAACVVALCGAADAAVVRGTVVENQTGRPLARATVALQPVAGTPGNPASVRTDSYGTFEFSSVPAGDYILRASRRGFVPTEYGQKQWNSAGMPISLTVDASPFVTIRLPRYGGITGTVVDENDVGIPQYDVVAYRKTQPPELVSRATTDDRGMYRIAGLDPGTYLVRSAAKQDEDMQYLPTFATETLRLDEARTVQVYLDEDVKSADLRPLPGRLFTLSGIVENAPPGSPVTVTLASDLGRQTTQGPLFEFNSLSPGLYELYAEYPENPKPGAPFSAAYAQINLSGNASNLHLTLLAVRETRIDVASPGGDAKAFRVLARRKDFAGVGPQQMLAVANNRALLAPGRWELLLTPPNGYYVLGFSAPLMPSNPRRRPEGWNEITVNFGLVRFLLSEGPGSVRGLVKTAGDTIAGAPVYLEGYDPETRTRVTDLRTTRTDLRGAYHFDGLAPGAYRVLATFEYQMPDAAAMDSAGAPSVQVEPHGDLQMDLELYTIR